jgi:hypothetical protein
VAALALAKTSVETKASPVSKILNLYFIISSQVNIMSQKTRHNKAKNAKDKVDHIISDALRKIKEESVPPKEPSK